MSYARCLAVLAVALTGACSKTPALGKTANESLPIRIDGSSTVYPITEAAAEEFHKHNHAKVTIGISGTGGGFKKLCAGEITLAGASRPIKQAEAQHCATAHIDFVELPLGYDGLAVVVHPKNHWASSITVAELKRIWEPGAQKRIISWNQVRLGWPDQPLHLFGPGVDSGTYDYFTRAIVGAEHESRGDYTSSEDDNVLVQGVSRDIGGLAFFGLAYYEENADILKLLAIDDGNATNGDGPVLPTSATVSRGTYQPLSRPIFLYVEKSALKRPEVGAFVDFYLTHVASLVTEAGYIALPHPTYERVQRRFQAGTTGSLFAGRGSAVGVTIEAVLEPK